MEAANYGPKTADEGQAMNEAQPSKFVGGESEAQAWIDAIKRAHAPTNQPGKAGSQPVPPSVPAQQKPKRGAPLPDR